MSSVTKTLALLAYFSPSRPEIGLSQLCRLAKRDKATTYRHLQALEDAGFIEQNATTKLYRLGPALLQLAQVRELTVPQKVGAEAALAALSDATGETAHVTVLSGSTVYPLASHESQLHGTRAIMDVQTFPLHATASGLCALAFGPDTLFDIAVSKMESYTANTVTTPVELRKIVARIADTGFGYANRSYEDEIQGVSAPIFDQSGQYAGAVSVACVATRFTPELEQIIKQKLVAASRDITRSWGGVLPSSIEASWTRSLSHPHTLENAS